jgi:hypothetical protein
MCVLHISSEKSLKDFFRYSKMVPYRSHIPGDKSRGRGKAEVDYGLSFDVSRKDFDDLVGQIADAEDYLEKHANTLRKLTLNPEVTDMRLDFPLSSRLSEQVFRQSDYFPPKFLRRAGECGVGIEISFYACQAESRENE